MSGSLQAKEFSNIVESGSQQERGSTKERRKETAHSWQASGFTCVLPDIQKGASSGLSIWFMKAKLNSVTYC